MKILAIDTSCDESCAAIVDTIEWRLLAESVHSQSRLMEKYGGVVPEIASREHLKGLPLAVSEVLQKSGLQYKDLDWIAVTNRPGLVGALLVGVSYAKALSYSLKIPYSVIHHIEAHLFSPLLITMENKQETPPPFPWIALVVSGGHSELFYVKDALHYQWLGGTLDDAAGEAFDKIGKILGFPYPAGPAIDRYVRENATEEDRKAFTFPIAETSDWDFSFSGLKTAVHLKAQQCAPLDEKLKLQLAASAQEAILDALKIKTELAQKKWGAEIVVTGGVACNSRLRQKIKGYFPAPRHCTDNAAMVALLASLQERHGLLHPGDGKDTAHPRAELSLSL